MEFFRNTPVLVQILWFYFALPMLVPFEISPLMAAALGISLNSAAFSAEIFRGGIQSIEPGQWEASRALGMTGLQAMRRIILPQAIRRMLPALTNRAIEIFKMSTLASAVAYVELLQQGKLIASLNFNPIETYTVIALAFFLFLYPLVRATYALERQMAKSDSEVIEKSMTQPLLNITGLHKSFGAQQVLRNIDLAVQPGERIAILGASGSGKSTFLRCLNFMETPSAGSIELGGRLLGSAGRDGARVYAEKELTQLRQRVGMVFQQFNLFPHMTAIGNVMEGLRTVKGVAAAVARERAMAELSRVGLADHAEQYPARLSGGQKQRVAIARALAMDPELLLFDEPTSALDPELVGEVLGVIRSLAEEGRTMLLVTHELGFAYHVATRVLFIADGEIHEAGTPDQVLKHPQRDRTRVFLARHREFSL